jgi:hypothetical protein
MAWKCPACGSDLPDAIRVPKPATIHDCIVCRAEVVFDPTTRTMALAPAWSSTGRQDSRERQLQSARDTCENKRNA